MFKKLVVNYVIPKIYKTYLSMDMEQSQLFMIKTDKALVIAPQAGDESIGMGGTIAKFHRNFKVICLTDGIKRMSDLSKKEAKQINQKELSDAMGIAKVTNFNFLSVPKDEIIYAYDKLSKTDMTYFDYIFMPSPTDNLKDYKALGVLMKRVLSEQKLKETLKVVLYELWSPLPVTNSFVDITEQIKIKDEMIKVYKSIKGNVINASNALSVYRGYLLNNKHSEAFLSFDAKVFIKFITSIYG